MTEEGGKMVSFGIWRVHEEDLVVGNRKFIVADFFFSSTPYAFYFPVFHKPVCLFVCFFNRCLLSILAMAMTTPLVLSGNFHG